METVIEQLIKPTEAEIAQLLMLFREIPGRTCSAKNYLAYLNYGWRANIAVFVVRKDDKIVGFTQASAPGLLDPESAWLPFSIAGPECGHENAVKALELAEAWMRDHGAKRYKVDTIRSPRAFGKAWNMKVSKEVRMEKEL
jgi:hypothetical protein